MAIPSARPMPMPIVRLSMIRPMATPNANPIAMPAESLFFMAIIWAWTRCEQSWTRPTRSEEHMSEIQSLMRNSLAGFYSNLYLPGLSLLFSTLRFSDLASLWTFECLAGRVWPLEQQAQCDTKCQANAYAHCQIIDDQTDGDPQRQSNSNASGVPVLHGHHLGLDQMRTIMDTTKRLLIMLNWRRSDVSAGRSDRKSTRLNSSH